MDDAAYITQEYHSFLQSLDARTKDLILLLMASIKENVLLGGYFTYAVQNALNQAVNEFRNKYTDLLNVGTSKAMQYAKNIKKAEFAPYINKVVNRLEPRNVSVTQATKALYGLEYAQISPVFTGNKDTDIIKEVWYKNWSDGLTVSDRVNLLSNKTGNYIENIIILGTVSGESPEEIEQKLRGRLVDGPEQKAMLRLAAHTINSVNKLTGAEILNDAIFIEGVRIMRSAAGSAKCSICVEHAGEVGGPGVEYWKDNGDDLGVLADLPGYHPYCLCYEEPIFKSVDKFVNEISGKYDSM